MFNRKFQFTREIHCSFFQTMVIHFHYLEVRQTTA